MQSGRRHNGDSPPVKPDQRQPTADEIAGMQWWNSMSEAERAAALKAAGWKSGGAFTPSAAEAWAEHKKRAHLEDRTDA